MATKERTIEKLKADYQASQEVHQQRERVFDIRRQAISHTVNTEGWKLIVTSFEKYINEIKEELIDTSPFRVFKNMRLRNQIKAYQKLYSILKTEEISVLLSQVK